MRKDAGGSNTALLVIDVQVGVVEDAYNRDAVIENILHVVTWGRNNDTPVIWVKHNDQDLVKGSKDWEVVPELKINPDESVVEKQYGDAFENTVLEDILKAGNVKRLVVVGSQTDYCVTSTLHGGLVRGYNMVLVADAHTTSRSDHVDAPSPESLIAHTNYIWSSREALGRHGCTVVTADIDSLLESPKV